LRKDIEIDEETKEKSLKVIKKQSERLSRMIEDLLVIPDIENSKLNIKLETINIEELKENLLALKIHENREYIINVKDGIHSLYADKDRLEQVIINILENANKYAYEGTPITANLFRRGNKAVISVINKADYIPPEKIKTLFEKFTRLDDKTTRTTRGTGLGLFIVKGLVNAMGGEITITSTPENEFIVEISLDMA
ncbi:GHKL domain-containing protein, partial [bacterium]|nr:GHKL domain-containing protein [bacterium]